ncbi:hypothetical protein BGK67_32250 [Streptomyces subrutilus]|uniref:Uncharacterized protein n=1 Tax=Streptomyces subrutilus TaxID=36818 RepID=A0A1E5NZL3_9ACTN|nr:hypothetical protein BGK67_32250 [Streptomyces subrutilus]
MARSWPAVPRGVGLLNTTSSDGAVSAAADGADIDTTAAVMALSASAASLLILKIHLSAVNVCGSPEPGGPQNLDGTLRHGDDKVSAVPAEGVQPGVRLVGFADPAFGPGRPGPVFAEADVPLDEPGDAAAVFEVQVPGLVRPTAPPVSPR